MLERTEIKNSDYYLEQSTEDSLSYFKVTQESGLSSLEAKERLEQFGVNEIDEKEEALWHRIFRRFWGPIPWMIEIAAFLSALVQKWEDFLLSALC